MGTPNPGRKSRRSRVADDHSGAWASSSQDFVRLATLLFKTSAEYAKHVDGNCSIYTLAGIPILFSALRCLLIELNDGMLTDSPPNKTNLAKLAESANDVCAIAECYPTFPPELRGKLELLIHVRHEIIHPAHRPAAEKNNTPGYLVPLRKAGLLQSTGKDIDYVWLSQLQSHGLFQWAFDIVRNTIDALLRLHKVPSDVAAGILQAYSRYQTIDADL
jgi:hypothetical protein